MAAEAGGDQRAGIGSRLKAAREKKGLTLLQAAERMHTDPRVLELLEAEDFSSLGAAVYVRGHMRHYAELVGEKTNELFELYANSTRTVPTQPDLTRIPHMQPDNSKGWLAGPAVIVLIGVAVIGTLWWFINSDEGVKPPAPAPTVAQAPTVSPAPAPAGVNKEESIAPPAAAEPVPVPVVEKPPALAPTPPKPPKSKDSELTLKFSADSWAEVYDASGARLFYDVGSASSSHTVKGAPPLRVVLGNPSGVALDFNGKSATIPSNVSPDGSVRFSINARGRAVPTTEGN